MVRMRYTGLTDPKAAFEQLKPLRAQLLRMQAQCRPFGSDYLILSAITKAMDTAAYHFTGEPDFFSLRPPRS
jgi:hypothetical protein